MTVFEDRSAESLALRATVLGVAAGMRSMLPLTALSLVLSGRPLGRVALVLGALGELVYDQLPGAQARTAVGPLAARLGAGGLAGVIVARRLGASRRSRIVGAATGALAAVAGTFLFHRLRAGASRRVPPRLAAVIEDLLALGLSAAAVRGLR